VETPVSTSAIDVYLQKTAGKETGIVLTKYYIITMKMKAQWSLRTVSLPAQRHDVTSQKTWTLEFQSQNFHSIQETLLNVMLI